MCGNAYRAVIGVTGTHAKTADGLECRVGHGNAIGTQCQCLGKISRRAQATRGNQGNIACVAFIQVTSRPGKSRNRGNRDIIPKNQGSRTRSATTPIKNNVVNSDFERSVDVFLNMLSRQFKAHRYATGFLTNFGCKIFKLA